MFKKRLKLCAKFQETGCFSFSLKTWSSQAKPLTCCSYCALKDTWGFLILKLSNQLSWAQSGSCPSLECMKLFNLPSWPLRSLVRTASSHSTTLSRCGTGEIPSTYPAPSSISAGMEKWGQFLFSHQWGTTVSPSKWVELKPCKSDLELWLSTIHRATKVELEWPSTAATSLL